MDRRRFITHSSAAAGAALTQNASASETHPVINRTQPAELRLASREFVIPGETFAEKLDRLEEWGFAAIELDGANLPNRVQEIKTALRFRNLEVGAVCSGYEGVLVHEDPEIRRKTMDSIKTIFDAAAEFSPKGLIVVPAFNGQTQLYYGPAREALMAVLPVIGEHAHQCGTRVLLEPLNRNEALYFRQLADFARICKEINHPGVAMMGDFYHMGLEEPCDYAAFVAARKYLYNVHLGGGQYRLLPGQDDRDFRDGFRGLKDIGYRHFCSLECFPQKEPLVEIPKSVEFLRQQWREA
ncbi:MAG: sugar phosphate isomerase/epimerase family protein [Candidatus Hinthialibacter antarcticus]|nr:sugar phosphate isomerase/epimerase family protein [Candidatus Hinthialibacter antarcticus]